MLKAIIFDIDGVLIDSFDASHEFLKLSFKYLGKKPITKKWLRQNYNLPYIDIFKIHHGFSKNKTNRVLKKLNKLISYPSHLLKTFNDCELVLEKLSKKYTLGIVTSRNLHGLNAFLNNFGSKHLFKVKICLDDVKNHKPHPEGILLALKKLKVKPKQAVYVGDFITDVKAAHAAGILAIGFNKKPIKQADYNAKNFLELHKIIKKIKSNI